MCARCADTPAVVGRPLPPRRHLPPLDLPTAAAARSRQRRREARVGSLRASSAISSSTQRPPGGSPHPRVGCARSLRALKLTRARAARRPHSSSARAPSLRAAAHASARRRCSFRLRQGDRVSNVVVPMVLCTVAGAMLVRGLWNTSHGKVRAATAVGGASRCDRRL